MSPGMRRLQSLPEELLQSIFETLPMPCMRDLSLVSRWGYDHAIPFLWKNVELVDGRRFHDPQDIEVAEGDSPLNAKYAAKWDEHDDKDIIGKLYVLACNPRLASQVQNLTHRCHLPPPNIFTELPYMHFNGPTMSQDIRMCKLVQLAVANMVNVQTLRIIYGHWYLTLDLLHGFLNRQRQTRSPLRRLWLESCSLVGLCSDFTERLDLSTLESLRLRRLKITHVANDEKHFVLCRYGFFNKLLANGKGGSYKTTAHYMHDELFTPSTAHAGGSSWNEYVYKDAETFDEIVYGEWAPQLHSLPESSIDLSLSLRPGKRTLVPPSWQATLVNMLKSSMNTLTSLNLDWIMMTPKDSLDDDSQVQRIFFSELSQLRFPNLRSFQLRNAVSDYTELRPGICLLENGPSPGGPRFLDFMEAHQNLQCLAWPMDRFFPHTRSEPEIASQARRVVTNLGRTLIDLRVDAHLAHFGEPLSDDMTEVDIMEDRICRRRFISEFAAHMTKLEQLKLEGGIPRDEKRETIRAVQACPLRKLVLIGVSCPVGNTWGLHGQGIAHLEPRIQEMATILEEEDDDTIAAIAVQTPVSPNPSIPFTATYGWPSGPPLAHTIAASHASTIEELKFCGYNGAPVLHHPTAITRPLLYPLRHFHKLRQIVLSFWLTTFFDQDHRDQEIIAYWTNKRDASSTALVVSSAATADAEAEANPWETQLREVYEPARLAARVAEVLGPHLSEVAKARIGGVKVRASFCLGIATSDIFDLEVTVGVGNQVLGFVGPREEGEKERAREKLESRRWF